MSRVVLGRKEPSTFVGFQWSGAEPEGLEDTEVAVALGALWEGDELVSYNIEHLRHRVEHAIDDYMEDVD